MYALMDVERALVFVNACGRGYNWIKLRFYLWLNKGFFSLSSSYNFNTDTGWLSGNFNTEKFWVSLSFQKIKCTKLFYCRSDSGEAGTSIMGFHGIWSLRNYWLLMHFLLKYISFQVFGPLVNSPIRLKPGANLIVWSHHHVKLKCLANIQFVFPCLTALTLLGLTIGDKLQRRQPWSIKNHVNCTRT